MWQFTNPSPRDAESFLERSRDQSFSYHPVGATRGGQLPEGFDHDRNTQLLGHGLNCFNKACEALRGWKQFPLPWTRIERAATPIIEGAVVAMICQVGGVWWKNAARIVYVINEGSGDSLLWKARFGFAYGTLSSHVETGEEWFGVVWHHDDSVVYELTAFSRPRYWMTRLAKPYARHLQRRFVADSKKSMKQAVT